MRRNGRAGQSIAAQVQMQRWTPEKMATFVQPSSAVLFNMEKHTSDLHPGEDGYKDKKMTHLMQLILINHEF